MAGSISLMLKISLTAFSINSKFLNDVIDKNRINSKHSDKKNLSTFSAL